MELKSFLQNEKPIPSKIEALALPRPLRDFLRHFRSFRLSPQDVVFRLWTSPNGDVVPLIVLGNDAIDALIAKTHNFSPESASHSSHVGIRRTLKLIGSKFYAFNLRRKIHDFIMKCAPCKLNNHPNTRPEKHGEHISTEPNNLLVVDFAGPYSGWAQSTSGARRYVFIAVDAASRFCIAVVTTSTSDNDVFHALQEVREKLCGLPRTISCDNAIITPNSRTRAYLEANHVRIIHGRPYISRDQSKAELSLIHI